MQESFFHRISRFAPLVLRFGIAGVILWFGSNQLLHPDMWVSWVPAWTGVVGISPETIVLLNGSFEVLAGAMLVLGVWTRIVAFAVFLHMCIIIFEIGINPTGVRDIGIALALLTLALQEGDTWSLTRDPLSRTSS